MEAIAKARNIKGSPRKARLVIDLIRGKNVSKALAILQFTNKRAADPIAKCLRSAIANATYKAEQQNIAIDPDDLWVKSCFVDMGPTKNRRRLRPAPQGRAYFERKHYCHITVEVSSEVPEQKENEKKAKKSSAKPADTAKKGAAEKTDAKKKQTKSAEASEAKTENAETSAAVEETGTKKAAPKKKADKADKAEEANKSQDAKADEPQNAEVAEGKAETSAEPIGTAEPENKPLAAQTDEEKTGTDEAADRQVDENEELERQ